MRTYTTATRRAILKLLEAERRYLTASSILNALKTDYPRLALSTVYRTLEILATVGNVSIRSDPSGEASYVFCKDGHHHHAICRGCGHVDEVDCRAMDIFRAALLEQQAFLLDEHQIEFYGLCKRCA